ncbi:MAG: NifU family protein [Candidatus Nanoarchaeia archaeon]
MANKKNKICWNKKIENKIKKTINELKDVLQADGGDIEFLKFKNGNVYIALKGHCVGCPFAELTVYNFIEKELKRKIPTVKKLVCVN